MMAPLTFGSLNTSAAATKATTPSCTAAPRGPGASGPAQLRDELFPVYQRPAFGFRPSEQRLLAAALAGGTDEELSKALMISLSAVKKTWQAIYERVAAVRPGPTTADGPDRMHLRQRGKEKKHGLLAYLREHPEELRPVSRRLLAQQAAAQQAAARRRS